MMQRILKMAVFASVLIGLGVFFTAFSFDKLSWQAKDSHDELSWQSKSDFHRSSKVVNNAEMQEGDIIFQTSNSGQSKAIQLATNSKYSHCGIIFKENGKFYVLEAVQPVKHTSLEAWIKRGDGGKYVTKRLKNTAEILSPEILEKMKATGNSFEGKNYDLTFEWSDERIYCSELVWKIYNRGAGIEVGKLQKLNEFDLSSEIVKQKMKERYGDDIPLDENVISPASIFDSELLETIQSN